MLRKLREELKARTGRARLNTGNTEKEIPAAAVGVPENKSQLYLLPSRCRRPSRKRSPAKITHSWDSLPPVISGGEGNSPAKQSVEIDDEVLLLMELYLMYPEGGSPSRVVTNLYQLNQEALGTD